MTRTIVVDLDGTLVNSDMLMENLFLFLRLFPLQALKLFVWILGGKASFKTRLADAVLPDVTDLPYNKSLISWLKEQKSHGAKLVLATASDKRIANSIADHLAIFDEVFGTESSNLSSEHKRAALVERFGEKGYEYIGNSTADFAVWRSASLIHIANPERGVLAAAGRLGEIGQVFDNHPAYLPTLFKSLRLHQWAKNVLVFVPLLASHPIFRLFPIMLSSTILGVSKYQSKISKCQTR